MIVINGDHYNGDWRQRNRENMADVALCVAEELGWINAETGEINNANVRVS